MIQLYYIYVENDGSFKQGQTQAIRIWKILVVKIQLDTLKKTF